MFEKLDSIKARYEQVSEELARPEVISDRQRFSELSKEFSSLEPVAKAYEELLGAKRQREDCEALLRTETDPEFRALAEDESRELDERIATMTEDIKVLLLPKDADDDRNVILEIRAGTGGDEAALFGGTLMRMYLRFAERHRFQATVISSNDTDLGGTKEAIISIKGKGVFSRLKYESGVHRVQRVPETESQGRIHTSAATVAVMCEADDVDIEILPKDIQIDTYCSSGAGGQHVNKTSSAIRITHFPTGLVVTCQNERSQLQNKEMAMSVLKSRLYDLEREKRTAAIANERKSVVGTGDRSERIRTYNFPQDRVTDHRANVTLYKLSAFVDGDMDEIIDALIIKDRMEKLSHVE